MRKLKIKLKNSKRSHDKNDKDDKNTINSDYDLNLIDFIKNTLIESKVDEIVNWVFVHVSNYRLRYKFREKCRQYFIDYLERFVKYKEDANSDDSDYENYLTIQNDFDRLIQEFENETEFKMHNDINREIVYCIQEHFRRMLHLISPKLTSEIDTLKYLINNLKAPAFDI